MKFIFKSFIGQIVRWLFVHMNFAIPLNRLRETDTLLAFFHPRPAYPFHVLLVPKKAVADLSRLDPTDLDFLKDLYSVVQGLVREFSLEADGYHLIVNGGKFQDFPQLHFHLISERSSDSP